MLFKDFFYNSKTKRQKNLKETAAGSESAGGIVASHGVTSAGNVAGFRGFFFNSNTKKDKKQKPKKQKNTIIKRAFPEHNYSFKVFTEDTSKNFDPNEVIAKLKNAAKTYTQHKDTVAFVLEEENGNLVKVWVTSDQADDFEDALEAALSQIDSDKDNENSKTEIAEVLWQLKNDFTIVDIDWGNVPEDQEEVTTSPEEETGGGETPEEGGGEEEMASGEEEMDSGKEEMTSGEEESDAKSALQQVIDMMKSDAEAKKAEAEAEIAKAKSEQMKYAAQAAETKLKQEEEILDMETYYDDQKKEKQETDRLAKLAKYRHELSKDSGANLKSSEEIEPETFSEPEEEEVLNKTPQKIEYKNREDLGDLIIRSLKGMS